MLNLSNKILQLTDLSRIAGVQLAGHIEIYVEERSRNHQFPARKSRGLNKSRSTDSMCIWVLEVSRSILQLTWDIEKYRKHGFHESSDNRPNDTMLLFSVKFHVGELDNLFVIDSQGWWNVGISQYTWDQTIYKFNKARKNTIGWS